MEKEMRRDWLDEPACTVVWTRRDFADHLMACGVEPTEEAVERAVAMVGSTLEERCVDRGWEAIEDLVDAEELAEGGAPSAREAFERSLAAASQATPGAACVRAM